MSSAASASDADLWSRACAGEPEAFAALYDRYCDRVYSYCFRSSGSWASAQDLASVVWLETWRTRRRATIEDDASLAPWLFGVAHNVVRNSARTQRRHQAALRRLPNPLDSPDHADEVASRLDDERRMALVLAAVDQLPDHERDVLTLVAWADLNQAEVAVALGISVGTVKSRLSRARERLRQMPPLEPDSPPEVLPSPTPRSQP